MSKIEKGIRVKYGVEYSFIDMMIEFEENKMVSFFHNNFLYFMDNDSLVRAKINTKTNFPYREYEEVKLNKEILNTKFLRAEFVNYPFIKEISIEEIRENLLNEKKVMIVVNENIWIIKLHKDEIIVSYEGDEDEESCYDSLNEDLLSSLIDGSFYVIA